MNLKTTPPTTKICAMCVNWNGNIGGAYVKPKMNMPRFYEFYNEEENVCFYNHFQKKAWHSCGEWEQRY